MCFLSHSEAIISYNLTVADIQNFSFFFRKTGHLQLIVDMRLSIICALICASATSSLPTFSKRQEGDQLPDLPAFHGHDPKEFYVSNIVYAHENFHVDYVKDEDASQHQLDLTSLTPLPKFKLPSPPSPNSDRKPKKIVYKAETSYRLVYARKPDSLNAQPQFAVVDLVKLSDAPSISHPPEELRSFALFEMKEQPWAHTLYELMSQDEEFSKQVLSSGHTRLWDLIPDVIHKAAEAGSFDVIHWIFRFDKLIHWTMFKHGSVSKNNIFKVSQFADILAFLLQKEGFVESQALKDLTSRFTRDQWELIVTAMTERGSLNQAAQVMALIPDLSAKLHEKFSKKVMSLEKFEKSFIETLIKPELAGQFPSKFWVGIGFRLVDQGEGELIALVLKQEAIVSRLSQSDLKSVVAPLMHKPPLNSQFIVEAFSSGLVKEKFQKEWGNIIALWLADGHEKSAMQTMLNPEIMGIVNEADFNRIMENVINLKSPSRALIKALIENKHLSVRLTGDQVVRLAVNLIQSVHEEHLALSLVNDETIAKKISSKGFHTFISALAKDESLGPQHLTSLNSGPLSELMTPELWGELLKDTLATNRHMASMEILKMSDVIDNLSDESFVEIVGLISENAIVNPGVVKNLHGAVFARRLEPETVMMLFYNLMSKEQFETLAYLFTSPELTAKIAHNSHLNELVYYGLNRRHPHFAASQALINFATPLLTSEQWSQILKDLLVAEKEVCAGYIVEKDAIVSYFTETLTLPILKTLIDNPHSISASFLETLAKSALSSNIAADVYSEVILNYMSVGQDLKIAALLKYPQVHMTPDAIDHLYISANARFSAAPLAEDFINSLLQKRILSQASGENIGNFISGLLRKARYNRVLIALINPEIVALIPKSRALEIAKQMFAPGNPYQDAFLTAFFKGKLSEKLTTDERATLKHDLTESGLEKIAKALPEKWETQNGHLSTFEIPERNVCHFDVSHGKIS